tara:strand:+ start:110 stop:382 length:273 start_codon:yes stop_codon:yes gene_type:complete
MKTLRIKQVGKHLTNSYEEWRKYVEQQQQKTIIKKHLVTAVDNVQDKLSSLNNKVLGEMNLFHGIDTMRKKTKELKQNLTNFIKSKKLTK